MKTKIKVSDEQTGYFIIVLCITTLLWYDYYSVYSELLVIKKKDLVIAVLFNLNFSFMAVGTYIFGIKRPDKFVFVLMSFIIGILFQLICFTIVHFNRDVIDFASLIIFSFFIVWYLVILLEKIIKLRWYEWKK